MTDLTITPPSLPAGHHNVPGGWVVLKSPDQITERKRRPILAVAASVSSSLQGIDTNDQNAVASNMDADTIGAFQRFNDLLAVALIDSWSFTAPDGQPLPVSEDGMLDLPGPTYDAIQRLVAPLVMQVMPNFDPSPDPASPTDPSSV